MLRFGMSGAVVRQWTAVAVVCCLALVIVWFGMGPPSLEAARDFEDCVVIAQAQRVSDSEVNSMMTRCGARFAGRRKPGGGYTYYDFMQDRKFDIAGPNPTAAERNAIDREYIGYLEAQRKEAISAALAKGRNDQLREEIEAAQHQPAGPPLVLTPTNLPPVAAAKRPADHAKGKHCTDDTLSCSLSKVTAAVKNAFASTTTTTTTKP